jgi:small subunit ribosomal protein S5
MADVSTTPAPSAAPSARPANQQGRGGNNRDNRGRRDAPQTTSPYEELVINIDRVARVVKGGRRFRFKALVVVGDRKGKVGVGVAKGLDVQSAVAKATDVEVKLSGAHVLLMPAAPGTGIIAGGVVRSIIGVTGINNMLSKSLGSTNKVNIAYATIDALKKLVPKEQWLNYKAPVVKTAKASSAASEQGGAAK